MLILIRLITAAVLFVFLFVAVYFAICFIGGAVCGAMAGAGDRNPQEAFEAGQLAGRNFVLNNMPLILLGSLAVSTVSSLALSFSGILPWCRNSTGPQPQ
jgi:hypothetical protein